MAALTADRKRSRSTPQIVAEYEVSATAVIYAGALVCIDTDGYAVPAADTASFVCVGVAAARADNSSGADGDISVVVESFVIERGLAATGLAQTQVGRVVVVADDQTVGDAAGESADIEVGRLVRLYNSGASCDVIIGDIADTAA